MKLPKLNPSVKKILKGAVLAGLATGLTYLIDFMPSVELNGSKAAVTGALSILLNIVKVLAKL